MAKKKEKTALKKGEARFQIIGEAKINDYTYKIDEIAESSDWVFNVLNLGIDCNEYGTVYAEMMGGYGSERDNVIYVHGKDEDGRDDYSNCFQVDWDDRFDEDILESVGNNCFITIGLEKDKKNKTFAKRFLSAYDAILYVQEHLTADTVVNVKGELKYSMYNGTVQTRKEIKSIYLSNKDDKKDYSATFSQTILLDRDSIGTPDKDKGVIPVHGYVVDYVSKYNGNSIKRNVPFAKTFELEVITENRTSEQTKLFVGKYLKVKKGVDEITFVGDLVEKGATVTATEDDIPDDIKELIKMGIYTLEEALAKCSVSGARERRMVITQIAIKMVGDDEKKTPVVQQEKAKYEEEDLIFVFPGEDDEEDSETDDVPFDTDESTDDDGEATSDENDTSWLDDLK